MASHHLTAEPKNLFWGYFDAATPPVLSVASGDEVSMDCLPAGTEAELPPGGNGVLPEHVAAMRALAADKGASPHIMTGPIRVEGARPGDVLQVDILEARPRQSWGHTVVRPLLGALPADFDRTAIMHAVVDAEAGLARLPIGLDLPLDPFFGVLAVAPPAHWGRVGAAEPRLFGGNMDNKELRPGTTLYLPVQVEGANFSAGDGHALQGDGEVCVSAVETALSGRFRLTVRRDIEATLPFAETPERLISMGFHADLDRAMETAVRRMIDLVVARTGLQRVDAYMLLSLVGDLRITQVVDGEKGVHMVVEKARLGL
jgi:acetamidase/formamidase